MKLCKNCNQHPIKYRTAKYCVECSISVRKANARNRTMKYMLKNNMIQNPGVGTGKANTKGVEDSNYTNGRSFFMKIREQILNDRKSCNRCNRLLLPKRKGQWCVHHIDHDRTNNVIENFELLCITCHNKEHKVVNHFKWFRDYPIIGVGAKGRRSTPGPEKDHDIVRPVEKSTES